MNSSCYKWYEKKRGKKLIFVFLFVVLFFPTNIFAQIVDSSVDIRGNESSTFLDTQRIIPTLFGRSLAGSDKLNFYYFSVSSVGKDTLNMHWKTERPGKAYILIHDSQTLQDESFVTKDAALEHSIDLPIANLKTATYQIAFLEDESKQVVETLPFSLQKNKQDLILKSLSEENSEWEEGVTLHPEVSEKTEFVDSWSKIDSNTLPLLSAFSKFSHADKQGRERKGKELYSSGDDFYFEFSFMKLWVTLFSYNTYTLVPLLGVNSLFQALISFILPIFLW